MCPRLSMLCWHLFLKVSFIGLRRCHLASTLRRKVFMMFMKPLMRVWRARGIMVFVYLDDIFIIAPKQQECLQHLSEVRELLGLARFLIYEKKCTSPWRSNSWGFLWTLQRGWFPSLPINVEIIRWTQQNCCVMTQFLFARLRPFLAQCAPCSFFPGLRLLTDTLADFGKQSSLLGLMRFYQQTF